MTSTADIATIGRRRAWRVERLTSAIGALIDGVDLGEDLGGQGLRDLRVAIHRYGVVFLRDQHLSLEQHRAVAERFGSLAVSPLHQLLGTGRTMSTIIDDVDQPPRGSTGTPT